MKAKCGHPKDLEREWTVLEPDPDLSPRFGSVYRKPACKAESRNDGIRNTEYEPQWKEAGELKLGDRLLRGDTFPKSAQNESENVPYGASPELIASIEYIQEPVPVYNLEVNGSTGSPSLEPSRATEGSPERSRGTQSHQKSAL